MIRISRYKLEEKEKQKIKIYMAKNKMTAINLANRLGINPAELSGMINGQRTITDVFKEFLETEIKLKFR